MLNHQTPRIASALTEKIVRSNTRAQPASLSPALTSFDGEREDRLAVPEPFAPICRQSGRLLSLALVFVLLAGCSKTKTTTPQSGAATGALTECVALWSTGNEQAAVEKFLEIDWNDASLFPSGTPMGYSEREFASLSEAQQRQIMPELERNAEALKKLGLRVKELGQQSRSSGNSAKAEAYFNCLRQCGTALGGPGRLKILQMIGKSIERMAI